MERGGRSRKEGEWKVGKVGGVGEGDREVKRRERGEAGKRATAAEKTGEVWRAT